MATERTQLQGILSAGGILDRIVERRSQRLEAARRETPLEALLARLETAAQQPCLQRPSFAAAVNRPEGVNIIAEIKRRSPSKGVIREDFHHLAIAESYARAGAAAMSILTEEDFFGGALAYLCEVAERLPAPLLRKDFVIDDYQLYEAKLAGASAVLLITAVLDDERLAAFIELAERLQIDALVEVHTAAEMQRACAARARLIGVNNRDLTTFDVTLETSIRLAPLAPAGAILVSESGIATGADIRRLRQAGYRAFLIGEHFMRQANIEAALRQLLEDAS